jgi:hypothetical protein
MKDPMPEPGVIDVLAQSLEPLAPPPDGRARLMAALEGPARYLPVCAELARHFALPESRMRELLACIDVPPQWKAGGTPLEGKYNFRPGPELAPLHGGFVRLLAGAGFPLHRHRDRELTFVLSGEIEDDKGTRFGPGSAIEMAAGSVHSLGVCSEAPALLAVLSGGIELLGG